MTVLKSIVLTLALANIGYFLWLRGVARSEAVPAQASGTPLKLASEVPAVRAVPHDTPTDVPGGDAASTAAPDARCVSVGPFRDVSEAAHAASTLRAAGHDPRQRVVDGEVWAGVWVYLPLPPAASRAVTDQMLAKLKANGIEDALEMPGPAEGSVISLGLFSEQKRAQGRVAQVHTLGMKPEMTDRKRNGNLYWIDVDMMPTDSPLDPANLQGEAGRIQRIEVNPCPVPPVVPAAQP